MKQRLGIHVSVLLVGAVVLRVAVVPAEVCPQVTSDQIRASIDAAAGWLIGGLAPDGRFTYGYNRESGRVNSGYNSARHAGVTMSLFQLYEATGDPDALAAADRGLAYALEEIVSHQGWSAWAPGGGEIPTGANGLLLAGMSLRRRATADPIHDSVMRDIGRFLVGQQQSDGSIFASWDPASSTAVPFYGPFATGEVAWSLALMDGQFPGEGWGAGAARTLEYMATERNRNEGYLTSLPDHWAAYTASELAPEMLGGDGVAYARRLAGYFGIRLRFEAQRRGTGLNLLLRWYPGPPAGVGTAGEGIGALHRLGRRDGRLGDLTASIEARLVCTAGIMVERQVTPAEAASGAVPSLEAGAWFYRGYTQMDDQQHVLSTLLAALPVVEAREKTR